MKSQLRLPSKRSAFSLLEMLIVITVSATIVAAACTMLVATIRTKDELSSQMRQRQTFDRLDLQLRRDLRSAKQATLLPANSRGEESVLVLSGGETKIEYRANPQQIVRQQLDAQGQLVRSEQYRWSRPMQSHWRIDDGGRHVTLSFTTNDPELSLGKAWEAINIVGVVGSDHRFAKSQEP